MTTMWKEICSEPQVLKTCREKNQTNLDRLVGKLEEYRPGTVVFAGRGSSDFACQYAKYLIEIYKGIPVSLSSPSVLTEYGGAYHLSGCLVIAVSQSGMGQDVLEVLKAGKRDGAVTVAITNNPQSPVAQEADYHLDCSAGPELSLAATKTFAAEAYLLFLLVAEWSKNEELLHRIPEIPRYVEQSLELGGRVASLVPCYRYVEGMFVLARGINFPIAMETALKMNETSYTNSHAYPISDFQHGPLALVNRTTPVLVISADAKTARDTEIILQKLEGTEAETIAITTNRALAEKFDSAILMPEEWEGPASFFGIMPVIQMFACKLAEGKGIDPDSPRRLKKVTITK